LSQWCYSIVTLLSQWCYSVVTVKGYTCTPGPHFCLRSASSSYMQRQCYPQAYTIGFSFALVNFARPNTRLQPKNNIKPKTKPPRQSGPRSRLGYAPEIVSQWCHSGVAAVLQWCYGGVTVVLQWCYNGVTVMLQWCYIGFTVVLHWCHSGVSA
jgi:hypothetical protein